MEVPINHSGMIDLVPANLRREWEETGLYPNKSVFELFRERARRHPEKVAVFSPVGSITYGELLDRALRLAAGLRARGVIAGDVVAYQLPNSWRCCAIDLAAAALGAIVAPFPPGRGRIDIEFAAEEVRCSRHCRDGGIRGHRYVRVDRVAAADGAIAAIANRGWSRKARMDRSRRSDAIRTGRPRQTPSSLPQRSGSLTGFVRH